MALIGWIGLGRMGFPMALRLVKAGHGVRGFDLSEESLSRAAAAGIHPVGSVVEAVENCDFVFTMLPEGADVFSVYLGTQGILENAPTKAILIDSSTISMESCAKLHELSEAAGFSFVDAPVSGGTMGAEAATLTFMVGCRPEIFAKIRQVVEPMAGNIFHTGGATTGQAAKICNNLILFINLASTAEGAVLANRLGLDRKVFWELASVSSADSWPLRNWYPMPDAVPSAASSRGFDDPTFTVRLAHKDVSLAVEAAQGVGSSVRLGEMVQSLYEDLIESGFGEKDCSILSERM